MSIAPADIVAYVGIPLAVLGVLPIMYAFVNGFVTLQNVRKILERNGLKGTIRGSILAGIVEIELPRWGITPLQRGERGYFAAASTRSTLPGGSWSYLVWNRVVIGKKIYRLQYSDDLREPQAEINFNELLAFLLDRGAVPDAKGIHMLRLAGLFTPAGTPLLLSPDRLQPVLRVSVPDDSDGYLSLALFWSHAWDERDESSLPPSWMRIRDVPVVEGQVAKDDASSKIQELSLESRKSASIRFHIGIRNRSLIVDEMSWEAFSHDTTRLSDFEHLQTGSPETWYPSLAVALGRMKSLALWTCHVPAHIAAIAQTDSLPCGVLVLTGLIDEAKTPAWATKYDPSEDHLETSNKFFAQQHRIAAEHRLPPEQAKAARMLREAEERHAFHNSAQMRLRRDRERREKREMEALNSPRLDTEVAARSALEYLQESEEFFGHVDLEQAAEKILFAMSQDPSVASDVCNILDRWKEWIERGGMHKGDLELIQTNVKAFCYAICMMSLLKLAGNVNESSVALDLQECTRVWQKVRLG